jgi:hypothetical protein
VSFDFAVDPAVVTLPDPMATYRRPAQPKRIQAAGATYPVTFPAPETLSLKGDAGFTATVSFAAGSATPTPAWTRSAAPCWPSRSRRG